MLSRIFRIALFFGALPAALLGETVPDIRLEKVAVEPATTSIYLGYVKLAAPLFSRAGRNYSAGYRATVFPFFFWNESGQLTVEVGSEDLQRLERGETIDLHGHAENSRGETRRVEGRAVPQDATHGKLQVRIFVSKKIQLIFNTTYRFVGGS